MVTTKTTKVTITDVPATSGSKIIAADNPYRLGFIIYNNSANSCYINYGPVASSSTCARILASFTQYESLGVVGYTGQLSAIRNAGTGTVVVTELT